jgi:hypothetical protein
VQNTWGRATTAVLLLAALAWLWSSLATIANFAFRYPAFDQYRLYPLYLGLPFPDSALQLENGHRPILPSLIRLAEIHWFDANQSLQIGAGLSFLLLAFAMLAWAAVRECGLSALQKATALLFSTLGLWWLGNARILMHGNELVHAYLVILSMVCMALAVHAARGTRSIAWLGFASLCAVAASFSFGSGLACFPALFVSAFVVRLPPRAMVVPALTVAGVLGSYLLGLPGSDGARNMMAMDPLASLDAVVMFLSSPWMNAWLGLADPAFLPGFQEGVVEAGGGLLVDWTSALATLFGANGLRQESRFIGAAGLIAWSSMLFRAWRKGTALGRIDLLALTMATFGVGVAALVSITRLPLFLSHPPSVLADRYLPWSCLFWLGLALSLSCSIGATWRKQIATSTLALLCTLALIPTHWLFARWSATVHRNIQQSAVAAQLGIWDGQVFPDGPDARKEDVLQTIDLLRARHLSMFSEPTSSLVESGWRIEPIPTPTLDGAFSRVVRHFDDPISGRHVVAIEGWLPRFDGLSEDPTLVIVDTRGILCGAAKPSHIAPAERPLRFWPAHAGGYDGYILDPQPDDQYDLVVLDSRHQILAVVALAAPFPDKSPSG